MATAQVLIQRGTIRSGDVVTLKAIIAHPMETGYRRTEQGAVIERNIIRRFTCRYDGEEVFACDLFPAIAASPLIGFTTVATRSGPVTFTWTGDNGFSHTETAMMTVVE